MFVFHALESPSIFTFRIQIITYSRNIFNPVIKKCKLNLFDTFFFLFWRCKKKKVSQRRKTAPCRLKNGRCAGLNVTASHRHWVYFAHTACLSVFAPSLCQGCRPEPRLVFLVKMKFLLKMFLFSQTAKQLFIFFFFVATQKRRKQNQKKKKDAVHQ